MFLHSDPSAANRTVRRRVILFLLLAALAAEGIPHAEAGYSVREFAEHTTSQESAVDRIRDQEIKQIQLILTRPVPQEQRADLMLRLVELYTERYRFFFFKENEIWMKQVDRWMAQGGRGKRPPIDNEYSRAWITKAVKVLNEIPTHAAGFSRLDEVYYFLGFHTWELGRKAESVRHFEKLVARNPKSKFASEAWRHIAESQFAQREFQKALSSYEQSYRVSDGNLRPRILYGIAWSHFKLGSYEKAVANMRQAIEISRKNPEVEKAGLGLQKDALDALALFFAEGGNASGATEYFVDLLGKEAAFDVLKKLANTYQRQGKYGKALMINKQLLEISGDSESGADHRYGLLADGMRVAAAKGQRDREAALLKQMVNEFVVNTKYPDEERQEKIQATVRRAATLAHQEGNKSKNARDAWKRAEELYKIYLSAFASHIEAKDAAEINYYLADVLSQLGRHRAAAQQYQLIVDQGRGGNSAWQKYMKDAAVGVVFSLDAFFKSDSSAKSLQREEVDSLVKAIDSYVEIFPREKEVPQFLARAVGLLVTTKRMDEARPRLLQLVDRHPGTREGLDAAVTLLKDAETRGAWDEVRLLSEQFLANRVLMAQDKKGQLRTQLEAVASRAKFKEVKDIESGQNFGGAAQRYEQLAGDSKDAEVRFKSLNNAAVNYSKAGDTENELRVYQKILASRPDDANARGAILGNANRAFIRGDYPGAAKAWEFFWNAVEKHVPSMKGTAQTEAANSLRAAALLRRATGDTEAAQADFRKIVSAANSGVGPAREAAEEFLIQTADKLRADGNAPESIRSYQRYVQSFPSGKHTLSAMLNTALLYQGLEEHEKAQNYLSQTIRAVKGKGGKASVEELGFGARARLILLQPLEQAYEKQKLNLPEKQLKADIKAKLAALDRLNKGYIEVIEFGEGRWALEAFLRMARAYKNFAEMLEGAPIPKEYGPEEKAKFAAQIREIARPVHLKVSETLENALKKGEQLSVADPVMARIWILSTVASVRTDRLPLHQDADIGDGSGWLMGGNPSDSSVSEARGRLEKNEKDSDAWLAIGNHHFFQGKRELARILWLRALEKKPKSEAARNNLAVLDGLDGNLSAAFAGFRQVLSWDEFATQPKKNLARIQMASGLWRHASLSWRQLEVRNPNDPEVRRGMGLSHLATGRVAQAKPYLDAINSGGGVNAQFADAIWKLGNKEESEARRMIGSIADESEMAALLNREWLSKETE